MPAVGADSALLRTARHAVAVAYIYLLSSPPCGGELSRMSSVDADLMDLARKRGYGATNRLRDALGMARQSRPSATERLEYYVAAVTAPLEGDARLMQWMVEGATYLISTELIGGESSRDRGCGSSVSCSGRSSTCAQWL